MAKKRLELTWIGKDVEPCLEPCILLEDSDNFYAAPGKRGKKDIFDNMLIFGDNLPALKALEQKHAGTVKCVYIDPPFNTGVAFDHYDDGVDHSLWLTLMRFRFDILRRLLCEDGMLFVHLDDGEMAYAKVMLDEIFGRYNYCNTITTTTNDPSGFKATGATVFSTANYILIYAKNKNKKPLKKIFVEKGYDTAYNRVLKDRSQHHADWSWNGIREVVAEKLGYSDVRSAIRDLGVAFEDEIADFAFENADRVFQIAAIGGGAKIKRQATINRSRADRNVVYVHPDEDVVDFFILNGRQMLFYDKRFIEIDGRVVPGEVITDVWTDISWNGIAGEGSVKFKNGKKPETLVKRILEMSTAPGDLVLDCFAGSGTTGAVAHKMGRRWIMVEQGEHCHTHLVPRMKKVIDGEDGSGITSEVGWEGGGGFRHYRLADSSEERDD